MRAPMAVGVLKSKGVPFTGTQLAGGDQAAVDRRGLVGVDHHLMAQDVALPGQVEVGVVRQVDHRFLVRRGGEVDLQAVVVGESVHGRDVQIAGIAFFAVLAQIVQLQGRLLALAGLGFPHDLVVSLDAAVEMIRPVVGRQRCTPCRPA